jgi:branched-chain amino acid transport system substrate-binding protein
MKQLRRHAMVAGLACALLATSCGRDEKSSSTDTTKDTSKESTTKTSAFIDPKEDCDAYDGTAGISGDTIKIGTVRPASGPYSIYDKVTQGIEKQIESVNSKGGVAAGDGKTYKLELVKGDDGYDPAKTPAEVKRLVETDGVFAIVGEIGTEENLAVRDYLNEKCVPSIALATGSTEWDKADEYPWFIGGLPSYATEAHAFIEWLKTSKPEAKIALLYQNDGFGKDIQAAVRKAIKGSKITVIGEESYDPLSGTTTEAQVSKLAQSGADTFVVGLGGTACPSTLKFIPADWKPVTYVSVTCSGKSALALAQGADEGVYSIQATLDPSNPEDKTNPRVATFLADGAAVGLETGDLEGGIVAVGWNFAELFETALKQATTVDRAGVMNAVYSLDGLTKVGLLRDEVVVTTNGAKDPWIIEGLRVVKRSGGQWTEAAPMVDYNGKSQSFAG